MPVTIDAPDKRPLAVSDAEGAALIGCGRTKLRQLIGAGEIRGVRIGRRAVVPEL